MKRFTVPLAARMYDIPLIDYCNGDDVPDRRGVLLASGSGIMMAVMDHVRFRWCLDVDVLGQVMSYDVEYRLRQFIVMAHAAEDGGVAMAGWFSITELQPFREVFRDLAEPALVYAGHRQVGVPGEVRTLARFIEAAKERWDPFYG